MLLQLMKKIRETVAPEPVRVGDHVQLGPDPMGGWWTGIVEAETRADGMHAVRRDLSCLEDYYGRVSSLWFHAHLDQLRKIP